MCSLTYAMGLKTLSYARFATVKINSFIALIQFSRNKNMFLDFCYASVRVFLFTLPHWGFDLSSNVISLTIGLLAIRMSPASRAIHNGTYVQYN